MSLLGLKCARNQEGAVLGVNVREAIVNLGIRSLVVLVGNWWSM